MSDTVGSSQFVERRQSVEQSLRQRGEGIEVELSARAPAESIRDQSRYNDVRITRGRPVEE